MITTVQKKTMIINILFTVTYLTLIFYWSEYLIVKEDVMALDILNFINQITKHRLSNILKKKRGQAAVWAEGEGTVNTVCLKTKAPWE